MSQTIDYNKEQEWWTTIPALRNFTIYFLHVQRSSINPVKLFIIIQIFYILVAFQINEAMPVGCYYQT